MRSWLAAHRSAVISVTSSVVVAAVVATAAIVSGGYEAQRLDLGDGSVWVAKGSSQVIGRANTEVLALDTVVETTGSELTVLQSSDALLIVDETESTLGVVDQATAEIVESVPLPPQALDVRLAQNVIVIHSGATGEVWTVPLDDVAAFDAESEPAFALGARSAVSLSPDGTLLLLSTEADELYEVDVTQSDRVVRTAAIEPSASGSDLQVTSVGGVWAVLDPSADLLTIEGRGVDLTDTLGSGTPVLQVASDTGDRVLVADSSSLIAVPLAAGAPLVVSEGSSGTAAAPVVVGECSFAAWSGGTGWRDCGTSDPVELDLASMPSGQTPIRFSVRGDRVVLNDVDGGVTWAVQQNGDVIANWDDLIDAEEDQEQIQENDEDTPPVYEKNQLPPVAVDDAFGARPGRASLLPVLLNDYDPNGDVLVVSSVDGVDEAVGRVDVINDGQRLQLTLEPSASGVLRLGYTVSDGRGGSAGAVLTVTVRAPGENAAPTQVRTTRATVAVGARVSTSVLGDWVDPDGDAFYLTSAGVAPPDTVSYKPEGIVVFQANGADASVRTAGLVVSDGTAEGSGTLAVTVRAPGDVPIIADPFVVSTYAGREVTVSPLEHVRGGTGVLRLASVPEKPGAVIDASLETGTFRFVSDQVRTHYLDYVVNDGDQTVTGTVRVEVASPPDANSTPITIPKTVFVRTLSSEIVDVASSDIDPAGGVLLVTEAVDVPANSGVTAEVLEQRAIRVTLIAPLQAGPVSFGYRITNGLAEAVGVITVVEIPKPSVLQPPVAADDSVTVRVGDAIDIPVLANDAHPDGAELTLDPELVSGLSSNSGLLFTSGSVLRYLAPERTGNFRAVYQISGPDGAVDQAEVTIAVREAVEATNAPPVPARVVARVVAGETVRIPIPLTGIDPDGDSVQLLGQETNPEKGSVTEVGPDYVDYLAGGYSAGTDEFTYTIVDSLGARATGTVRVGISPRSNAARNPIAVADEVTTRPGKTISVQVLANDSDPDGGALAITAVTSTQEEVRAEVVGDVVEITPPPLAGRYGLVYSIQNELGGTSSNFVVVVVDPDAPPAYPVAKDTVLTLSDIVDRDEVTVDVLANVFFADGDVSELDLSVLRGYGDTAQVTESNRLRVQVTERRQIIPFAVANPDDPTVVAYAFVWLPGSADALPQLDRTARTLSVASEATVDIDINDFVIAVEGKTVRLADATSVQATHANGDSLVVDDTTLRYTSADGYFGPASLSFEVTDGTSATDPEGRTATLVLPIRVTPRENPPPVFTGGVLDFEPGETKTIDLLRLTLYPNAEDLDELVFSAPATPPAGFDYRITDSTLVIQASPSTPKGTSTALAIGVRDSVSEGQAGRLQLGVVASTRPLARPAADSVIAQRGRSTTIDVLANDEATNPFPGRPLEVVAIGALDGGSLPEGVTVSPSADNSRLTVSVSATAAPIDTNLQYQVADVTGDAGRFAFGSVTISVQDRPDAPAAPVRADGGYEEGLLTLRITAPQANNSPITSYVVTSSSHGDYRRDCGLQLRCALTDLQPGLRYQFSVAAVNAIGVSDPSAISGVLGADYLPAAPRTVSAVATAADPSGGALRVSWSEVADPDPGSAIVGYTIRITGPGADYTTNVGPGTTSIDTTGGGSLVANAQYVATVYARNSAFVVSDADWRRASSAPVTTIGPPSQTVGGVQATVIGTVGDIRVTWGSSDPNGGSSMTYSVGRFPAGGGLPTSCSVGGAKPGLSDGASPATSGWVDTETSDQASYQYVVYSENELFCTVTASGAVETKVAPGAVLTTTTVAARGGQYDLQVGALSVQSGVANRYEVQFGGAGQWSAVTAGTWLTSFGSSRGVYGTPVSVAYRACRDASESFCGPASSAATLTPVDARGSLVTCTVGETPISNAPSNGGAPSVQFQYSYNDGGIPSRWSDYEIDGVAPEPGFPGTNEVRVRMQAIVTFAPDAVFVDPGFVEGSCG
ncbi:MAG: hypothetical protein RI885_2316 [Actinomycetota bacterium]